MNPCTIYNCEQRTEEWHSLRKGVLTASEMGAWLLTRKDKRSRDAREKAICSLMAQAHGAFEPETYVNEAMRYGIAMEPEAVACFEQDLKVTTRPVGFCRSNYGRFGCSPDALIGDKCGLEGKCPIGATHLLWKRRGELPAEHKFQVHGCMAVTGAESWWFQSYCPNIAPFRVLVERDDFTEKLLSALIEFSGELEAALREEAADYEKWRAAA